MAKVSQTTAEGTCDICGAKYNEFVIDGATTIGPWAWMCTTCHKVVGKGLGPGRGQKYSIKTLEKVEG